MGDCCSIPKSSTATKTALCGECGAKGRAVPRMTILHHVKSEKLSCVHDEEYKFCATATCSVVYYAASGQVFTIEDVRELVTAKAKGDSRPLCYCFGFTEGYAREEIRRTGKSTVAEQISQLIKEKMCACEIRNPASVCCLGQVNSTVNQLLQLKAR
jgi:hypothetical protein